MEASRAPRRADTNGASSVRAASMRNEDNKVEPWEEAGAPQLPRQTTDQDAVRIAADTPGLSLSDDPVEQDQMYALIDNQTQLMKIMDRDRNRIQQLEARIRELQGQVIQTKQSSTASRFMQTKDRWMQSKERWMQTKDRWRNQNDAGTQTDVLVEAVANAVVDAEVPVEPAIVDGDDHKLTIDMDLLGEDENVESKALQDAKGQIDRDNKKTRKRNDAGAVLSAKSMGAPDLLKHMQMADLEPEAPIIHEASMSEANHADQLSVGDGRASSQSSVKLPSESYESNLAIPNDPADGN